MLTIIKKLESFQQLCGSAIFKTYFKTNCFMNALMDKVKTGSIEKNKIKACQLIINVFEYLTIFQLVNILILSMKSNLFKE